MNENTTAADAGGIVARWLWPSNEEINDFPDPLGFDREWREWTATMSEGPSVHAEVFAREYLQNSWDSIQAQVAELETAGEQVPQHGVEFRFVRLHDEEAQAFVSKFGLNGHRMRFNKMSQKHQSDNRLGGSDLITSTPSSVEILIASERCGQGMFGPWLTGGKAGVVSRLKSALMHTRSDKNNQVAGGSWGHGKKAIANASKCRTIAVYSNFGRRPEYPGDDAEKRLLGVSYWKSHDLGENAHVGLGLLGAETETSGSFLERFRPLKNEESDQFVKHLGVPGFAVRDSGEAASLGTSYLIVEPAFGPDDLVSALERNWWPLIGRDQTHISVTGYDGSIIPLLPEERTELRPFLHARDLATGVVEPRDRGDDVGPVTASNKKVGLLALTSDDSEHGWSWSSPDENRTLVALVRNDMVIAYEHFPRRRRQKGPFMRGVLLVDRDQNSDASELLRMSEPHLHNEWQTIEGNAVPQDSAKFAEETLSRIQKRVGPLRASLLEKEVNIPQRFASFSRVFSEGKSPSVSPPKPIPKPYRPFQITGASHRHLEAKIDDPTQIRAESTVHLSLTEKQLGKAAHLEVLVTLGWKVMQEANLVSEASLLDLNSLGFPEGFTPVGGTDRTFRGVLTADPKPFTWQTTFFPDDWCISPDPVVEAIESNREGAS